MVVVVVEVSAVDEVEVEVVVVEVLVVVVIVVVPKLTYKLETSGVTVELVVSSSSLTWHVP